LQSRRDHPPSPAEAFDLDQFEAEARNLIEGPRPELPPNVFAPP
jgi:hypothetical protein